MVADRVAGAVARVVVAGVVLASQSIAGVMVVVAIAASQIAVML